MKVIKQETQEKQRMAQIKASIRQISANTVPPPLSSTFFSNPGQGPVSFTHSLMKSFVAPLTLLLALVAQTAAHAIPNPALGVKGTPKRSDVQRPSSSSPCGSISVVNNIDTSTTTPVAADGSVTIQIQNFNAGTDGSTALKTVSVNEDGTGKSFATQATIKTNGNPDPSKVESDKVVFVLPQGTKCTGGKAGNLCVVSVVTTHGFGACTVVSQGKGGSSNSGSGSNSGGSGSGTESTTTKAASGSKSKQTATDTETCPPRKTVTVTAGGDGASATTTEAASPSQSKSGKNKKKHSNKNKSKGGAHKTKTADLKAGGGAQTSQCAAQATATVTHTKTVTVSSCETGKAAKKSNEAVAKASQTRDASATGTGKAHKGQETCGPRKTVTVTVPSATPTRVQNAGEQPDSRDPNVA
ncbi:hypothetical protein HMN09_01131600 [Mycena chlorophos]|uniref:Uncharacterized protein n=1 Tax=Mycena chlorophos TaxID=658473 RepID=A0A8H6SAB1_MYCCL|nr:hypothetical protein HMN09_01131600 [Mycena chlorophos]